MNAGFFEFAREHENSITTALQLPFTSLVINRTRCINRKPNACVSVTKSSRLGLDRISAFEKTATPDFAASNRRVGKGAWHNTNEGRDTPRAAPTRS
jgi:hypothetical protein